MRFFANFSAVITAFYLAAFSGGVARGANSADSSAGVIFDMDTVRHTPLPFTNAKKQKLLPGTAELVEGKFGKAVKFTFIDKASGGFMSARVKPTADWDNSDGFSFWVKGDGSGMGQGSPWAKGARGDAGCGAAGDRNCGVKSRECAREAANDPARLGTYP